MHGTLQAVFSRLALGCAGLLALAALLAVPALRAERGGAPRPAGVD
ncbi:hypothetical protein [Kineococcus indalonis]|nr:hypothetical protein [Kineococcus indalonis]